MQQWALFTCFSAYLFDGMQPAWCRCFFGITLPSKISNRDFSSRCTRYEVASAYTKCIPMLRKALFESQESTLRSKECFIGDCLVDISTAFLKAAQQTFLPMQTPHFVEVIYRCILIRYTYGYTRLTHALPMVYLWPHWLALSRLPNSRTKCENLVNNFANFNVCVIHRIHKFSASKFMIVFELILFCTF